MLPSVVSDLVHPEGREAVRAGLSQAGDVKKT